MQPQPRFDVEAARAAGYGDAEIVDFLAEQRRFDAAAARSAGYSDRDLLGFLVGADAPAARGTEHEQRVPTVATNRAHGTEHLPGGPTADAQRDYYAAALAAHTPGSGPTQRDVARRPAPESVMADYAPPEPTQPRERTPVRHEVRAAERAAWEAATPEQRAALEARPDWRGSLHRQTAADYADAPQTQTTEAIDPRREHRIRQEIAQGARPEVAANIVDTGAAGGSVRETPETLADRLGRMAAEHTGHDQAAAIVTNAVDLAGSLAKVAPTTAKLALDVGQLVPLVGQVAEWGSDALADVVEDIGAKQSAELQGKAAQLAETLRNGTPDQVTALLLRNPDLLADVAIPSAGSIFVIGGAGGAIGRATAARYAGQVSPRALARIQQRAATEGAIWTNAAVNAGAAFDETDGPAPAKYLAALIAGAGTRAAGLLTRGGAEGVVARGGAQAQNRVAAAGATAMREGVQEFGEGASEATGVQVGELTAGTRDEFSVREILNRGTLEGMAGTALGGAIGAVTAKHRAGLPLTHDELEAAVVELEQSRRAQFDAAALAQQIIAAGIERAPEFTAGLTDAEKLAVARVLLGVEPTADTTPQGEGDVTPTGQPAAPETDAPVTPNTDQAEAGAIDQAALLARAAAATAAPETDAQAASHAETETQAATQASTAPESGPDLTPRFEVTRADGKVFGRYSTEHDARNAIERAGPGATLRPLTPPETGARLDHGELNIPGRTNTIDAELDRFKAEQARAKRAQQRADAQQRKADKAEAKQLFAQLGQAIIERHGDRFGRKELAHELERMVKWEPAKFITLARKFEAEQQVAPAQGADAVTVTPMLMTSGRPFRTERLAAASAKQRGLDMVPVEVEGGWGLIPTPSTQAQPAQQPEVPQPGAAQQPEAATPPPEAAPQPQHDQAKPEQPTRKQRAAQRQGRTALLDMVKRAKQETAAPELVAEYHELMRRVQDARRRAGLKKTKAKEARELTSWADNAEADTLPRLREKIGYRTFTLGASSFRVLNTPENLDAFAKKVRSAAGFNQWRISPEEAYDQLDTRPGTTDGQREAGRHALHDLARRLTARAHRSGRLPEGGGAVTLLGSGLYADYTEQGGATLVGRVVESPADLATLAQVFRDPRFETTRVFYTDTDGRIIGEAGYSNRLPAAVFLPNLAPDIQRDAAAYGAAGYYILHNHPSGRAEPSPADLQLTKTIAAAVPGFQGHVVIDRNEYAVIDEKGYPTVVAAPQLDGVDFHAKPELEHKLLGLLLNSPEQVATFAKALQIEGGHATVVFTRAKGEVQLLVDLPVALLQDDSKVGIAKLKGVIRRMARAVGAGGNRFVVLPEGAHSDGLRFLIEQGLFIDVVSADGASLNQVGVRWPGDFMGKAKPAARVAEGPYSYESELTMAAEAHGGRAAWQAAKDAGRTKLNYRQWVQVRTPSFINWFGDWRNAEDRAADQGMAGSATGRPEAGAIADRTGHTGAGADAGAGGRVDPVTLDPDTGEPRVFHHGTADDIAAFDLKHANRKDTGWLGRGIYVTSDDFLAETYARIKRGDAAPNVLPLFVRADNVFPADLEVKRKLSRVSQATVDRFTGQLHRAGFDGAALVFDDGTVELAAFRPEQVKSAIANRGTFDPLDADIVREEGADYSRVEDPTAPVAPSGRPLPPEETLFRRAQRVWQDKMNRFTVVQDWLKQQGVNLTEAANVFRAEERMHGRTATHIEDFREKRVKPLIARIRKAGFTLAEVADYLHAQHAEERNAQIARINKSMPDGGSGMSNAEAQTKLAQYAQRPELVALANELRAITDDTRQILLDAGILSQEMADAWTATYQHYAPLKGVRGEDAAQQGTGKGLTVKQKNKRALGHGTRDEWIVENILRDHERAILQAEKNRVGQHLLALALEAANEDLITIGQPVKRKVLRDAKAYEVRYQGSVVETFHSLADAQRYVGQESLKAGRNPKDYNVTTSHDLDVVMAPSPVLDPSETQVYVQGHAIRVQFKDGLLARAWNNLGAEHMNLIFRMARGVNTWLSRAYTGFNPEFLSVNVMRDFTTGVINLAGEEGAGFVARTVANYPKAFGELLRYAFTGNASNWVKQYRADGGTTGAAYLSDLERIGRDVQDAYDEYAGVMQTLANGGPRRAARAAARKMIGVLVGWIEKLNQAGENAMRLSAYRAAVETGKSRAQAAALAKNATVNFNRKGEIGHMMGALYLFFNPAVQGSASIAHALFKGKHKHQAQALTAGLVALGYFVAKSMGGADEDEWEKVAESVKERYLPIWTGDGWVKIPVPYGYGFFYSLGRQLRALELGADPAKVLVRLAASFVKEFSIWGPAADAEGDEKNVLFLLPTIPQIVASPLINRTSLGAPIYPESAFDQSRPDSLKMWRATQGTMWQHSTQALNAITGGNAAEKGWLDVSPETLKFLWNTATGGTGRFVVDGITLGWNLTAEGLAPADIEMREVPIARKFYAAGNDIRGARARFWKHAEEAREALEAFNRAKRIEDHAERGKLLAKIHAEQAELIALGEAQAKYAKAVAAQRDAIQAAMADESRTLAHRRALVKQLERDEAKLYDDFVALFKHHTGRPQKTAGAR